MDHSLAQAFIAIGITGVIYPRLGFWTLAVCGVLVFLIGH